MRFHSIVRYLFGLVCLLSFTTTPAQNGKDQKVISIDAGSSLVGGAVDFILGKGGELDTDTTNNYVEINNSKVSGGRTLLIGFDYGISSRWSLGGFISTQRRHGSTEFSFLDSDQNVQTEKVTFDLRRNAFGFSPKLHFGKTDHVDLYSGIRMGLVFWTDNINSPSGQFDIFDDMVKSRPFFGLTALGVRFYPTENVGLKFELNLGAPNIIGLGAVVKLK